VAATLQGPNECVFWWVRIETEGWHVPPLESVAVYWGWDRIVRERGMGIGIGEAPSAMCNGSQTSTVSKFKETKAEMFLFSLFLTAAT